MLRFPIRWIRGLDPVVADGLLALALATLDLVLLGASTDRTRGVSDPNALAVVLLLLQSLPLVWRRRRPAMVLGVVVAGFVGYHVVGFPNDVPEGGLLVALYSVAAYCPRRRALVIGSVTISAMTGFTIMGAVFTDQVRLVDAAPNLALLATIWVVGSEIRTRRSNMVALEERAVLLEREREEEAHRAVTDERSRIARELHDVVAHHVSVMVVQAGAARRVLDGQAAQVREALASVEATGKQALVEMRHLLGVLRADDDASDAREPQPGIGKLEALLASVRTTGLPVDLAVEGEPRGLPSGVDVSAYRVVQEALTNALKHAGPARAHVLVRYADTGVEVQVNDDGRGIASDLEGGNATGSGQGLVGMRERVALFGGELQAGPRSGGGFAVTARFPT